MVTTKHCCWGGGGGECSVIACYSRFVCLTSWRHVTYFNKGGGGGSRRIFWVWNFDKNGLFWVYDGHWDLLGRKKNTGIFFGALYFSTAQINNNISATYCKCGIFWSVLKQNQVFFGVDKFWIVGIFLGKTIRYEPPSLKSINQSINQSIVLLSLLQFPKTELQGVHIQLAQGGLKGIPMMLCGQQLGKKACSRGQTSGFRRSFGKISVEDSLYLWPLGNAIFIVICYLLILHNFLYRLCVWY